MKKFIYNVVILTVILSSITLLVNYVYINRSTNWGTIGECKNDTVYIANVPEKIEICNFGNSHGYYGFDYTDYTDSSVCFNFSLPSQSMSYNYRILENYQDSIAPGAVIFICISHNTFFCREETSEADFASKNKRYYHFLDKQYIKEYDFKTDIFVNYLPALSTNPSDLIQTALGLAAPIDYWKDTTSKEYADIHGPSRYELLAEGTVNDDGSRRFNKEEIKAAYDMIALCRKLGATPILITTPFLSQYTKPILENNPTFYDDFYGVIEEIQKTTDVDYYDYQFDARFAFNYDYFFNTDHLNRAGAKKFTEILMQEIICQNGNY